MTQAQVDARIDQVIRSQWEHQELIAAGHARPDTEWRSKPLGQFQPQDWVYDAKRHACAQVLATPLEVRSTGLIRVMTTSGLASFCIASIYWYPVKIPKAPCRCESCAAVHERREFLNTVTR